MARQYGVEYVEAPKLEERLNEIRETHDVIAVTPFRSEIAGHGFPLVAGTGQIAFKSVSHVTDYTIVKRERD